MKRNLLTIAVTLLSLSILGMYSIINAASVTFEVDTKGQEFDAVELFVANKPRVIDVTKASAYTGTATRFTVNNLQAGQTYDFAARLRKGDGVSELSNIIQQKISAVSQYNPPNLKFLGYDRETGGLIFAVDDLAQTYESIRLFGIKNETEIDLYGSELYNGTDKTITITGLPPGEQWRFHACLMVGATCVAQSSIVIADIPVIVQLRAPALTIIQVE